MTDTGNAPARQPSLVDALIPIGSLVILLGLSYYLYGDGASAGPNQVALLFCALAAIWIAVKNGMSLEELRAAGTEGVATGLPAIFILLAVGSLIGTWAMSGTILAMVYYGLQLLSPDYFYMSACAICALVAVSIGSSWTTAGTVGIGLMGIAANMEMSLGITAGAIISGAYFGDKCSPLSDTTNLACAAAGSELFTHIRETLFTSVPSLALALTLFWMLGEPGDFDATSTLAAISAGADVSVYAFLPLAVVLGLAIFRFPPFTTIFLGSLVGGLYAVVAHPDIVIDFVAQPELAAPLALIKGVWTAMANGFEAATGDPELDVLLTRGGMESMLGTIWLIMTALAFGGIVEKAGLLDRLINPIINAAKSVGQLVGAVVGTGLVANILTADQYIAIVLPGRMFKRPFAERGLQPVVLSRAVGDSATVTSPLIPWNSCGAYMAAALGVPTVTFAAFCFFNLINPLMTILFAVLGIRMLRTDRGSGAGGQREPRENTGGLKPGQVTTG